MAPPDEVLKERFARIDERFDEVNFRITEGKEETNRRFDEVNRRITEGKEETGKRFDRVESDIKELKTSVASIQQSVAAIEATLTRIGFGLAVTFASILLTRAL